MNCPSGGKKNTYFPNLSFELNFQIVKETKGGFR